MVGIHERKGRAKIFSSQVEHIMNDPVIADYIRSFKRLISFCESNRWYSKNLSIIIIHEFKLHLQIVYYSYIYLFLYM